MSTRFFLFVAAENDAIPKCKAGGMGDVVRDVPRQIASRGDEVSVVCPAYSRLHIDQQKVAEIDFTFRGSPQRAEVFEVAGKGSSGHQALCDPSSRDQIG